MRYGNTTLAMGLALLLAACSGSSGPEAQAALPDDLVGIWILEEEGPGGLQVFSRSAILAGDRHGYQFAEHGGLRVRRSGWYGTPSVTWSDVEGLWRLDSPAHLAISHAWRGSPREYQLEIVSVTPHRLTCRVKGTATR